MGSNLVIAAIPDENDRVWKISSEKVPHLTLLFLGDVGAVKNLDQIILFVEHAANTTLRRFYLSVDRRGELGADQADVLFFKIGRYEYKTIRDFRAALLQDNNIKTAYDSSTQFDGVWQPHLTLGYPATPAKDVPDDYTFYDVAFNKIAVWTNDFDGPEFLLKDYGDEINLADFPMDIAMSDTRVANLQHHGVRGMKWGVRKQDVSGGTHIRISQKTGRARLSGRTSVAFGGLGLFAFLSPTVQADVKAARAVNKGVQADKKWKRQLGSARKAVEVHNMAAGEINSKLPAFNKDKRWKDAAGKDVDLTKNSTKMEEYNRAAETELLNPAFSRAAIAVHGSGSPGGRYKFEIKDESTATLKLTDALRMNKEQPQRVLHATTDNTDTTEVTVTFKIMRDSNGYILGFEPDVSEDELAQAAKLGEAFILEHHEVKDIPDSMAQTTALGADFLMHYGVKGMRWGVRREQAITTQTHIDTGLLRRKTQIQAKGGQSHPPHQDAVKVEVARQKLKKSGAAALSNQELREMRDRIQLETQVKSLMTKRGKKQVQKQLEESGKQQLQRGIGIGLAKGAPHVLKKAKRAGAVAGAAAALA
jgi:2'-5' RNA ligase